MLFCSPLLLFAYCLRTERRWSSIVMCLNYLAIAHTFFSIIVVRSTLVLFPLSFSPFQFFLSISPFFPSRTTSRSLYSTAAGLRSSSCPEWMVKGRSVSHLAWSIACHGSSEHNLFLPHHFTGQQKSKNGQKERNWSGRNVIRERGRGDEGEVQASSY